LSAGKKELNTVDRPAEIACDFLICINAIVSASPSAVLLPSRSSRTCQRDGAVGCSPVPGSEMTNGFMTGSIVYLDGGGVIV
jgi:hypothetical protein